jgi:hypothetical protein
VRDRPWALVLLGTLGLGATFARPEAAASFVVRSGGALAVIPLVVGLAGLVLPALLVERREERSLPLALARHGSAGELLGWVALCQAWWIAVWVSLTIGSCVMVALASLRDADPHDALLDPSSTLVPAVPWLLALIVARRRRTADLLRVAVAAGVALVFATLVFGLASTSAGAAPLLLDVRPGLLLLPRFWLEGLIWAMTLAAAGAGLARGRASVGAVLAGVSLAGAVALAAAVSGALGMVSVHGWPDVWTGPAWSRWLVTLGNLPGGEGVLWTRALVALLVAAVWVTATVEGLSSAIAEKWHRADALWLPAAAGMVASVALAWPRSLTSPDVDTGAALFAHLLTPWIFGLGLPLCAVGICWFAREEVADIAAALDPLNRHRTRSWLPVLVRWVAPALGAFVVLLQVAVAVQEGPPGQSLAVRGLGRIDEVAYVVVPIAWALSTFVASTALTWIEPGAELRRDEVTA